MSMETVSFFICLDIPACHDTHSRDRHMKMLVVQPSIFVNFACTTNRLSSGSIVYSQVDNVII